MLACDGSTRKHSPSGNNNQQGGADTSQTSDSVANNWSPPTGCCCRSAGAPVGVAPIEPSCHAITCQSCEIVSDGTLHLPIALCVVSRGPALLDTKGRAQLLYQGRREVCPPAAQQLSGHCKDRYEALVEHLCNCLRHLVLCHHSKAIPREMVGHHKDIFNHEGLIQLHCGLDTGVIEMHKLQQSIRSNQTKGSPWHFSLECLAAQASPYYRSAILHHHGPPKPFLGKSQGPLLALMASILVYPIKRHVALSHGDDEG